MVNRRPKRGRGRRFSGQPRIVVWCAWKDCPLSVAATAAFCPKHLKEVFRVLWEKGMLRPEEETIPVSLRPTPTTTDSRRKPCPIACNCPCHDTGRGVHDHPGEPCPGKGDW